jgi:prepilin-type processing-associated H-X9-DG protein
MKSSPIAFTLVELLVVVALLALVSALMVTALAKSKSRSSSAGCLSNLRQLQTGCATYSDDNNGTLIPNAPVGSLSGWCGPGQENWYNLDANTNPVYYRTSIIAPYISSNITVFRCPGDVVPSDNGQRIRSYSMNGQMGTTIMYNSPWRSYFNESDLTCPTPKDAFIFCDEHPGSLDDGYLQLSLNSAYYPNVPASYLEGGCGFSFADGHAEIHKWRSRFLLVPVMKNVTFPSGAQSSGSDLDWIWLKQHSSCLP